jgi:hypothetical protein
MTKELVKELETLGVREFEISLFTVDVERGWAALQAALGANADNPIRYAMALLADASFKPQRPRHATNLAVDRECEVCGGDRFVVAGTRKPVQSAWMKEHGITPSATEEIEEMKPCPVCGPKL